jgi:hypothetical protein
VPPNMHYGKWKRGDGPERLRPRVLYALTSAGPTPLWLSLARTIADVLGARPKALVGPERPDAMALVARALDGNDDPALGEKVLVALANMAKAVEADPAQAEVVRDVLDLAMEARSAPPPARMAFATALLPSLKSGPPASRRVLADRLLEVAPAQEALDIIFEDPKAGMQWAEQRLEGLDPALRPAVARFATAAATSTAPDVTSDDRRDAILLAGRADPDGQPIRSADAALGLLEHGAVKSEIHWLGEALPADAQPNFARHLLDRLGDLPSWKSVVAALDSAASFDLVDPVVEALPVQFERFLDAPTAVDAIGFAHYLQSRYDNQRALTAVYDTLAAYFDRSFDEREQGQAFLAGMLDELPKHHDEGGAEEVLRGVSRLGGDNPGLTARIDQVRATLQPR